MYYDQLLVLRNNLSKLISALKKDPETHKHEIFQMSEKLCEISFRIARIEMQTNGYYRSVPKTSAKDFKRALKYEILNEASNGKSMETILRNAFETGRLANPGVNLEKSVALLREKGYFSYSNPEDEASSIEITLKAERFLENEANIRR